MASNISMKVIATWLVYTMYQDPNPKATAVTLTGLDSATLNVIETNLSTAAAKNALAVLGQSWNAIGSALGYAPPPCPGTGQITAIANGNCK